MIHQFLLLALVTASSVHAASGQATLQGRVLIQGRIEKVQVYQRFSPYSGVYGDGKPAAELAQDLIVYLEGLPPGRPQAPARLSQKNKNFTASIVPIVAGGQVEIRNEDTVRHHIRSKAQPWSFNLRPRAPGETVLRTFEGTADGSLGVAPVYCDIHSGMRAHVLVMPNAHWKILPETGGSFRLSGLPAGNYTLTAWHPTLLPQKMKVTLKAGKTTIQDLVMKGKQN